MDLFYTMTVLKLRSLRKSLIHSEYEKEGESMMVRHQY